MAQCNNFFYLLRRCNISRICNIFVWAGIILYPLPCWCSTPPPIVSVPTGTLDRPKQVAIAGVTGATIYYTTDGVTTPTSSSSVYVRPLSINYSLTLKAIAVLGGVSSTVSSASYTLDPTRWPAPNPADSSSLKIDLQLPTTGIPNN